MSINLSSACVHCGIPLCVGYHQAQNIRAENHNKKRRLRVLVDSNNSFAFAFCVHNYAQGAARPRSSTKRLDYHKKPQHHRTTWLGSCLLKAIQKISKEEPPQ